MSKAMGVDETPKPTIEINGLRFTYPEIDGHPPPGYTPLIDDFSLTLRASHRCLLIGSNGAGKTTILKILGGKHMVEPHMIRVLGRSAFHDTSLTSSCDLSYLGGEWRQEVALAGFEVLIQMDVSTEKMIYGVVGIDPKRRAELIKRMHKASDGQRRRVQICMGLLKPFKVLLLDEITVDLDVLARANLLRFLRKKCEERGATIIFATHIFDGLEDWPSYIVYVADGMLQIAMPMEKVKDISKLSLMIGFADNCGELAEERTRGEEEKKERERHVAFPEFDEQIKGSRVIGDPANAAVRVINNGWATGRLHYTIAGEESIISSRSNEVGTNYKKDRV